MNPESGEFHGITTEVKRAGWRFAGKSVDGAGPGPGAGRMKGNGFDPCQTVPYHPDGPCKTDRFFS